MNNYIYFMFPIVSLVFVYIENKKIIKDKQKISLLFFLLFFSFAALRGNGDGDYFNYINGVKYIDSIDKVFFISNYPFEMGFRAIAYINNFLKLHPQFTIATLNIISLINIKYLIDKYSESVSLSWFIYIPFLFYFDMHHTRNAVAISFVATYFFSIIVENDFKKGFMFGILAVLFHSSSIFPILIISIYYVFQSKKFISKIELRIFLIGILVSLVLFNFVSPINLFHIVNQILPGNQMIRKIISYLGDPQFSYKFSLFDPRLWLLILIVSIGLKRIKTEHFYIKSLIEMIIIGITVIFIFSDSTMLVMRLYNYFNIFSVFYIPSLFKMIQGDYISLFGNKKLSLSYSLLFVYFTYFIALASNQVPYFIFK